MKMRTIESDDGDIILLIIKTILLGKKHDLVENIKFSERAVTYSEYL